MSNTIICPNCSQQNHTAEQFCRNCGLWLQDFETRKTFSTAQGTAIKAQVDAILREHHQHSQAPDLAPDEIGLAIAENTNLLIMTFEEPILLGRDTGDRMDNRPLIDFNDYRGYIMGVSRKHAMIFRENGQFMVMDFGSSNGTFVNDVRLEPNIPQVVENGDSITLGQLHMRFFCG